MDLALFDFDGTITTIGTYPGFLRYAVPWHRQFVGAILLSPVIAGYHLGLVSERGIRSMLSRVSFWRTDPERLCRLGELYARDVLPRLVRPSALDRIAWHQSRGDHIVVVSASLEPYLAPWCRQMGVDLICSCLEISDGRLTGRYVDGDCCGEEKRRRILERYDLTRYATIHAYGDTEEDRQMLELAARRFMRWEEI